MNRHTYSLCLFFLLCALTAFSQSADRPLPEGASYELGFSPGPSALSVVLDAIHAANTTLLMAAYEMTNREIADALIDAQKRGVKVAVVVDYQESLNRFSLATALSKILPLRRDARYKIEHTISFASIPSC